MNIAKFDDTLEAADLCRAPGPRNSSAGRAYHAMFQAAQGGLGSPPAGDDLSTDSIAVHATRTGYDYQQT